MQALQLKATILYKNLDARLIARAITSPRSLIASNAPSVSEGTPGIKHYKSPQMTATFSSFLSLVEEQKLMSFEDAIRKLTTSPAKKFGMPGKGEIIEGNFADFVCFRGTEIKFTVVNGRIIDQKNIFPGKILRHPKGKATS